MGQRRVFCEALLGVALALGVVGPAAAADDQPPPLSRAQIALFESDHLKSITKPVQLDYAFQHHGGAGNFDDKVSETIHEVHDNGSKDISVAFLSGERQTNFPPVSGFHGNPVLMYFLEHDVMELHQATGGASLYFRNRIRRAFFDGAEVHPTEVTVDGKMKAATEIVITPFRNDAQIARFPGVTEKSYRFVLCDAVPGTIYQISTSVPKPSAPSNEAASAAFAESMTYTGERDATP